MIPIPVISQPPFHPRQLFAALQGAWLEPTPGYIWQENTGVTPTTGGQTIGKIADQSGGGNNATQATAGNRPLLGRRYNLLTYSEDFSNAAWGKGGLNAFGSGSVVNTTATTDPDGGNTASYIQEDASNGLHRVYISIAAVAGRSYTWSIYAKAAQRSWIVIDASDAINRLTWFDLTNGTVGTVDATRTASIKSIGNGWFRCTVSGSIASGTVAYLQAYISTGNNVSSYTGDGTSGIYLWGADFRLTADVGKDPAYQRITTATDYDYGQYPAAYHDTTDSLVVSLPSINVRRNLLTWSEQFNNAAWIKGNGYLTITPNTALGPNGIGTASTFTSNGVYQFISYTYSSPVNGANYCASVFIKKTSGIQSNYPLLQVSYSVPLAFFAIILNTTTGVLTKVVGTNYADPIISTVYSVGDYWRIVLGFTATTTVVNVELYPAASTNGTSLGATTGSCTFFGAQLELGSVATDYQKITDWTSEAYSSNGSVYFATPVGMSSLHNQSMGTTYNLPALSSDIYSWIVVPQRLSAVLESRLERYMLRKANLTEPDYLLDDDGNQLMSDDYELLLRQ